MESFNYIDVKSQQFLSEIYSHFDYGSILKDSFILIKAGYLDKPFEFGFIERTKVPKGGQEFANKKFQEYFPGCKLLDKLS